MKGGDAVLVSSLSGMGDLHRWVFQANLPNWWWNNARSLDTNQIRATLATQAQGLSVRTTYLELPTDLYTGGTSFWAASWHAESDLVLPFISTQKPIGRVLVVMVKLEEETLHDIVNSPYAVVCRDLGIEYLPLRPLTIPLKWVRSWVARRIFITAPVDVLLLEDPVSSKTEITVGRLAANCTTWAYSKVTRGKLYLRT